jgi:hypothetical protein
MIIRTFTGADVSLMHIAARLMGDATLWYTIAQANDLSDYMVTGTVTLVIPTPDPTLSGGIPQQ